MLSVSMRIDVGDADADAGRADDVLVDGAAGPGVDRLAVGDAVRDACGIEHDRGSHHRARQRSAAGLVDAGDRPAVQLELDGFQLEGRLHARESPPLSPGALRGSRLLSKERAAGRLAATGRRNRSVRSLEVRSLRPKRLVANRNLAPICSA